MSRRSLILFFVFVITGCSILKEPEFNKTEYSKSNVSVIDIKKLNLTKSDFQIQKATGDIVYEGKREKLIATVKFKAPDIFLLSIKSLAGIEVERILITKDTILINDRINKKLFLGSSKFLEKKYGITFKALPLIFGDYIDINTGTNTSSKCKNGKRKELGSIEDHKVLFEIDCQISKVLKATVYEFSEKDSLVFNMTKFKKSDDLIFPEKVTVENSNRMIKLTINIEKIINSKVEKVDFIPGNNYERILIK